VRSSEGEPDRSGASEQVPRVIGWLIMTDGAKGRRGCEQRAGSERGVEHDHPAIDPAK
jgi:hypothetical protein